MQWSKLKQLIESRFADSLSGRLQVHLTRYRWTRDEDGRIWFTLDKIEVASMGCWSFHNQHFPLAQAIRESDRATDYRDPAQRTGFSRASEEATQILHQRNVFSEENVLTALREYLQLPIDAAVSSNNVLIQALAMLDRRVGKRRLRFIGAYGVTHPLVRQFLQIRFAAEGLTSQPVQD